MAEPIRLYIEISITETNLKKLLNSKFEKDPYKKKLGYYFSQLLYDGFIDPANLFILNFDKKNNRCFIAYAPRYFENTMIEPFKDVFKTMSVLQSENTTAYAIFATPFPNFVEGYMIKNNGVIKIDSKAEVKETTDKLHHKFWSFSENNDFPEPKKALSKHNYLYKNFKNYYKRYLSYIEECEKPNKISKATKENPYHLFDDFYTYDNKVFQFRNYTRQVIEIPQACPLTFRKVSAILADKNYVFLSRLSKNSPQKNIRVKSFTQNNPNAIWEYYILDGVDGKSFDYVKEKWDTIYWKDKKSVFIFLKEKGLLKKIEQVDSNTFKYLDFCYGKDKNHIFYYDTVLPIDTENYTLNKNGFIFDGDTIFHYQHKIALDAKTFKVLQYQSTVNPFIGTFIIEDKNGKYEYNRDWKNKMMKPIN